MLEINTDNFETIIALTAKIEIDQNKKINRVINICSRFFRRL